MANITEAIILSTKCSQRNSTNWCSENIGGERENADLCFQKVRCHDAGEKLGFLQAIMEFVLHQDELRDDFLVY